MIRTLLSHQWKSFWRSRSAGKNLAMQLVIGFFTIYLLASATSFGFFLKIILEKMYPGQDIIKIFFGFIFYYFLFETLSRFLFQDLPTLTIQPYLAQNIKRSQLIRFLNVRSLFTIFNLLPLLLFAPFAFTTIGPVYGFVAAIAFIVSIIALTIFNHFLILYLKRKSIINSWWMVAFFVISVGLIAADYFKLFSLSHVSAAFLLLW